MFVRANVVEISYADNKVLMRECVGQKRLGNKLHRKR